MDIPLYILYLVPFEFKEIPLFILLLQCYGILFEHKQKIHFLDFSLASLLEFSLDQIFLKGQTVR